MDHERLDSLLVALARLGGSALHLEPGAPPGLRLQRRLVPADQAPVDAAAIDAFTRDLLFADQRRQLAATGSVEVLYVARDGRRHRVAVQEIDGVRSVILRPVPLTPPKLEALELPAQVGGLLRARAGLLLVAGCFGSGRSTTLAAMVGALAEDPARHVVTIETPIEFWHPPGAALLHQREVGVHVASVAEGLQQAVAIGADTVVVTDLADGAALGAALAAAESGCWVVAGFDAGSVVSALADLQLLVPIESRARVRTRLSRVLRGVTAQALLPRQHRAGQVPVVEVLVANAAARQAIRLGTFDELPAILRRCRGLGMQTADIALRGLLERQLVSPADAELHAMDRQQVFTGWLQRGNSR